MADLAAYNNGRLHGAWVAADREPDEIYEDVAAMLSKSPIPGAEEFAIHDYENFYALRLPEYIALQAVSRVARGIAEHGEAYAAWTFYTGTEEPAEDDLTFEDAYIGEYDSEQAMAEEYLEETGVYQELDRLTETLGAIGRYVMIDVEQFAHDMDFAGEVYFHEREAGGIYAFRTC